jgi:hypothetical protein
MLLDMGQVPHVRISIYLWPTIPSSKCIMEELPKISLAMACQ